MNIDLRIINAEISKIQGDCKNASSPFFHNEEFRMLEIARVDTAIQTLRAQHVGQDLPDLSALESSWERFKANISEVDHLKDIKSRILSLARILAPRVLEGGSATAAAEDPDVQETEDLDEEEKAERLKAQKERLPQDKPNLFKAIQSLARNIVYGKYGNIIKTACIDQHPSIVYRDSFLRLLLIERSMNLPPAHTQHEIEWDLSEEAFERFNELQEEMKTIFSEEKISLLQKISSTEEGVPLTENEKKLFDTLNEAIHLLKVTKDEELIYPQLLYEKVEGLEKVHQSYKTAFSQIKEEPSTPLKEGRSLKTEISKLRSGDPQLFFYAIDRALEYFLKAETQRETQREALYLIGSIMEILDRELETDPQIIKSFSQESVLWGYFFKRMNHENPLADSRDARFSMLMIPTLFEKEPDLALKLTQKVLEFIKEGKEEVALPSEFIQEVIKHQPQLAAQWIPYLSKQERAQYFVQQIYAAKEAGRAVEIPGLLERCRFEARSFMQEILLIYSEKSSYRGGKESADRAKIKIRQFLAYFRSELKEFFQGQSAEEIEFDLLFSCLENPQSPSSTTPLAVLLIPELVRLGRKERSLEISRRIIQEVKGSSRGKSWIAPAYALLKASGFNCGLLDEGTLGPLMEPAAAESHPLDRDFTALYWELMRSLGDSGLYIVDVIDLSMYLGPLAREFSHESYQEFSLQVTELLKELLPKAFELMKSYRDPLRKVKTLIMLLVGFSVIGEIDRVIPTAHSTLDEIRSRGFPDEHFLPLLHRLAAKMITSIKILHTNPGSDAPNIQALKADLVSLVFQTISKMSDVEHRIEALLDILDQLEECNQEDEFYRQISFDAMNWTFNEIIAWNAIGEFIKDKINALEYLERAGPLSQELKDSISREIAVAELSLREYRLIQKELEEFEIEDGTNAALKIERCIDLINREQGPEIEERILRIYGRLIDQVESPKKEELIARMEAALVAAGRTSPEDDD